MIPPPLGKENPLLENILENIKQKNWDDLYTYLRLLESLEMKFHGVNREHQKLILFETYSEDCMH